MTIYLELLRLTVESETRSDASVDQLLSEALVRREALAPPAKADTHLAAQLAYDSALVRLCRRLGVETQLLSDSSTVSARPSTEQALASILPGFEPVRTEEDDQPGRGPRRHGWAPLRGRP